MGYGDLSFFEIGLEEGFLFSGFNMMPLACNLPFYLLGASLLEVFDAKTDM